MSEHPHCSSVSGHLTGQLSQVYIFISMLSQCFCQALGKYNLHAVKIKTFAMYNWDFYHSQNYTHIVVKFYIFFETGYCYTEQLASAHNPPASVKDSRCALP